MPPTTRFLLTARAYGGGYWHTGALIQHPQRRAANAELAAAPCGTLAAHQVPPGDRECPWGTASVRDTSGRGVTSWLVVKELSRSAHTTGTQ